MPRFIRPKMTPITIMIVEYLNHLPFLHRIKRTVFVGVKLKFFQCIKLKQFVINLFIFTRQFLTDKFLVDISGYSRFFDQRIKFSTSFLSALVKGHSLKIFIVWNFVIRFQTGLNILDNFRAYIQITRGFWACWESFCSLSANFLILCVGRAVFQL